ncbi:CAAX amino terminal protease self- immunity [compost metagenome]
MPYIMIALLLSLVLLSVRIKQLALYFNKDIISMLPIVSLRKAIIEIYSYIFSAVWQELFYKAVVIIMLSSFMNNYLSVVISALLFTTEHYLHRYSASQNQNIDYFFQFILSATSGYLYLESGSLIIPIAAHLFYNLPISLTFAYRYYIMKARRQVYD